MKKRIKTLTDVKVGDIVKVGNEEVTVAEVISCKNYYTNKQSDRYVEFIDTNGKTRYVKEQLDRVKFYRMVDAVECPHCKGSGSSADWTQDCDWCDGYGWQVK